MPLPWLYQYLPERALRRGQEILRPVVPASIPGAEAWVEPTLALVNTGSENVFAEAWLAEVAGIDLDQGDRVVIGLGGGVVEARFAEAELRLHAPEEPDEYLSWRADVGFVGSWPAPFPMVVGQRGFLDQFTVTFHRGAGALAVEAWDEFDARFGRPPSSGG